MHRLALLCSLAPASARDASPSSLEDKPVHPRSLRSWHGFLIVTALALGPACVGGNGDSATSGETSASGATTDDATGSTSGSTTPGDPSTGTDQPTTSASTTTTGTPTTDDSTISDSTIGDSTIGDSTTQGVDNTTGTTTGTTTDTTDTTDTTTEGSSSSEGTSTTGIGGEPNVLYVHPDGVNNNPGTKEQPMRTIQWAIEQAKQMGTIDTIRVAEGEYTIDYSNDDYIVIADGVSLYGGYRADWVERDPAKFVTKIVDGSLVTLSSNFLDPHRSMEVPAGVQASTVIDGFHISVARGKYRAAVFVQGDATISNNIIEPLVAIPDLQVFGLRIVEGHPTVVANRFRFKSPASGGSARAIFATASNAKFFTNLLDLSNVLGQAYGFQLSDGAAQLLGNSILLNGGGASRGIYLEDMAEPIIDNNLIEGKDAGVVACIQSQDSASVPSQTRNNVLNCETMLLGSSPVRIWKTVMQLEGGLGQKASKNLKVPQVLISADDDMVLDAQAPCTVTTGGRDITGDVPVDINGVPYTVPLSIGAHEWNSGCQ